MTTHTVDIRRHDVWRVLDMIGLTRIDLSPDRATLTFATAPGCEPVDEALVLGEVARMGAIPLAWTAAARGDQPAPSQDQEHEPGGSTA